MVYYIIQEGVNLNLDVFLHELFNLVNIVSSKYLLFCFISCIYFGYTSVNDKILYTSYTSDNYNDQILSNFVQQFLNTSKFNIHYINNKILHPITLFLQNL